LEEFVMAWLFGRKSAGKTEILDPDPGTVNEMPARPYRVLHAGLPFYSDPECTKSVDGANLIVLRSEDPEQTHQVRECMPTRKKYRTGQLVRWDLDKDQIWQNHWFKNPDTGAAEKAWEQAVGFIGKVVTEDAKER
jgi:hypothetical protein